ncbi:MAG: hypothetical protein M1833_005796 [Piccolia ochrophora]|nr:MAG: hypothetical protein M1833_005796 [Piccolia ochrophora]
MAILEQGLGTRVKQDAEQHSQSARAGLVNGRRPAPQSSSSSSSSTADEASASALNSHRHDQPTDDRALRPTSAPGVDGVVNGTKYFAQSREEDLKINGVRHDSSPQSRPSKPQMQRSKSDFGPRSDQYRDENHQREEGDGLWMRHGWEAEHNSEEYLTGLTKGFYLYFTDKRYESSGNPKGAEDTYPLQEWRMRDRLKTVSAALAICLNLGVDPPDVIKTNPCAKLECWVDPSAPSSTTKALEQIGSNLQHQYEQLSIRTRYRQHLDPSVEETKKFCSQLRRNAKDERVLFHYNGHGVPKPTSSGEIWVFNKTFTQYIPISLYDLQLWLGAPSLFVYDCSDAGNIIHNFNRFVEKHEAENADARRKDPNVQLMNYDDCIQLAACGRKETLPTNPDLPADLFTCCLTTPIEIALRFYVLQNPLPSSITVEDVMKMPGRLQERRTPMGELNWIFTAITDTIAWNTLPRSLFKKLFRQDLMVAALFRNFLLSQRIMRVHQCHPQSWPELPETHQHPLWQSWDLAVEMVLAQLPALVDKEDGRRSYEYQHSTFFTEQLTAFEVYLSQSAVSEKAPDQLPIVLQVLLSQVHRLRALILLSRFLDLGPWAVNLALSIGIFPYVLKLLQSAAAELKPVMIFIWARILAVDQTCQVDLLKDSGYKYFTQIIESQAGIPVANAGEHRAMCAFIIAMFCHSFHQGQVVCTDPAVIGACLTHLGEAENPLLRQWSCLCISELWVDHPEAKWLGIREMAPQRLCGLAFDPIPEVRGSMLHALNNFLGIPDLTDQVAHIEETLASTILTMTSDGNSMVRRELVVFFSTFVNRYENKFIVTAYEQLVQEKNQAAPFAKANSRDIFAGVVQGRMNQSNGDIVATSGAASISHDTVFESIWKHLLIMSVDPYPEVADPAGVVVDHIHHALLQSSLAKAAQAAIDQIVRSSQKFKSAKAAPAEPQVKIHPPTLPPRQPSERYEGSLFSSIKRTASVAASLKNLAFGGQTSADSSPASAYPSSSLRQPAPARGRTPAEWTRPPNQGDLPSASPSYHSAKVPLPKGYKKRSLKSLPSLPLKSRFLEWSIEYFREPQMKPTEADEPGSTDYNQRLWRRTRNEKIMSMTQPQKEYAASNKWDNASGFFNNGTQPMKMIFHQFEDHLAVADDRDTVCIWDWEHQGRLSRFSNGNPKGSKINEMKFINEDDQALLMIGSSDGVLKVFRNYETDKTELVAAWRALTDLVHSNFNAGLVFDWQQGQGRALVAGDVKVIRVWNIATELCTNDIPARSGSCITSLTSDQVAGDVFAAGFGDGAVRVYDQRLPPREAMVRVWKDHKQWITNIHMQRGGLRELVSGSRNGEVKLWDIRMSLPLQTINATKDTLRSLSVHEHAPVFAMYVWRAPEASMAVHMLTLTSRGTGQHAIKVFNTNGKQLSRFEPYSSFLHQNRSAPIAATSFHPHRMMLACSALNDNHVNVFTCDNKQKVSGVEVA